MKKHQLAQAVFTAMLGIASTEIAAADSAPAMEKCYGIVKAGKNDCGVKNENPCAAQVKKDSHPHAWIFVPKGTCDKIVGARTSVNNQS
jgi:uncharacterized membrane protein